MKISTVQEKFNQAPEKIQDIVLSVETSEALYEIEKKYGVYKEENGIRILPKETTDVLIGITHPKDFVPVLGEKLNIPKERAQEIAREVNQKIFSQVKDLLIELHGLKKIQTALSYKDQGGAVPQKKEKTTPISSPVPQAPKNLRQLADRSGQASQKPKNPFEEKLKQTFTIPNKQKSLAENTLIPKAPEGPDEIPPPTGRTGSLSSSPVSAEVSKEKKDAIKNNPYLETIE